MRRAALVAFMIVAPSLASADDGADKMMMAQVLLTTDSALVESCQFRGSVSDDSVKDLRRKIVRLGGNAAVITFTPVDLSLIVAKVYVCPPPPPPGEPPPPPPIGPPPPPPPSR